LNKSSGWDTEDNQKNGIDCGRDLSVEKSIQKDNGMKNITKHKTRPMSSMLTSATIFTILTCAIIILFNVTAQPSTLARIGLAETDASENVTHVYLIHPMLVDLPDGDIKMVYRIRIHNRYSINNNAIHARPIFADVYGKNIIIPLYNIRFIVEGNNKFKEHILE